jgi:hypothetical protein
MSYRRPLLALAFPLAILAVEHCAPSQSAIAESAKDPYQGFFLEGTGDFGTKCTVSICKAGSRYYDLGRNCAVLSAPPKWEAFMTSDKRKIYMPVAKMKTKNQLKQAIIGSF